MLIRVRQPLVSIVLAVCGALASAASPGTGAERRAHRPWPVPIDISLSSSFAEFRAGHLHAGLDIRTYGREGVPCLAVGKGHISRMRASHNGYGRALYLTLDSGETAVYAHLSEFAPRLEDALARAQSAADRYRVDVYFESHEFPVESGEVIAYTGSTGASAPHLHFEFRDRHQNPMNPLSHGWVLEDDMTPDVKSVVWLPLSKAARIGGECRSADVALERIDGHTFMARDTLTVSGRVGLGAHIIDRTNPSSGRLAPYRVELTVDGVLLASIEMERFTYAHTGEVELAYEMERVRTRGHHYLLLFRRQGESLWNRTFHNDGAIDAEILAGAGARRSKVHTAVIRTIDRAGNVSVASVPFVVDPGAAPPTVAAHDAEGWYFFQDLLSVKREAVTDGEWSKLVAWGNGGVAPAELPPTPATQLVVGDLDRGSLSLQLKRAGELSHSHVVPLRSGERYRQDFPGLGISIAGDEGSLYADAFMYVSPADGVPDFGAGSNIGARSDAVRVGPVSLVLKRSLQLGIAVAGEIDGREGVYRLDERRNEWQFAGSEVRGDTVYAAVGAPGTYRVFIDDVPPTIAPVRVTSRRSYATGEAWPMVVVAMDDAGSGIDSEATTVYVNGERHFAEWNGFSKKMFVIARRSALGEANDLHVVAVDRAGNETTLQSSFAAPQSRTNRNTKARNHGQ